MIFGIKTLSDYRREIEHYKNAYNITKTLLDSEKGISQWFRSSINETVFENSYQHEFKAGDSLKLIVGVTGVDLSENNATLYCGDDNYYLYLSKKLTDGYTHLSINYRNDKLTFILNNENVGLEIDSNNRVKHKSTIMYLKRALGISGEKSEIFFEKIPLLGATEAC